MRSVRTPQIVVAVAIAAVLAVGSYAVTHVRAYSEATTIGVGVRDFKELSDRFAKLAQDKGAEYAFQILGRAELPPQTDLHLLGHIVGDELYKQEGVDGIAICTQDFRNACSHSIVIGTLNEYGGEPALEMIRDACKKAPGGGGAYTMCYHGLGHGVFAFYGYDLEPTIDFCKKTGTEAYHDREYIECAGGAVMELMGGGGHDREKWLASREKYLREDDPLSPCLDGVVPDDIRELCLIYLTPQLWELADIDLGRPNPALFSDAFAMCDAIPTSRQNLRDACFGGFGKEFVPLAGARDIRGINSFTDEEFGRAIEWCTYAKAPDGIDSCVSEGVASVFWGGENDPEASFRFCALAEKAGYADACYKRLASDVSSYTAGQRRAQLCERIPSAQRGMCGL